LFSAAAERCSTAAGEVRVLTIDGSINPHTARYLERGLQEARTAQNAVVVVRLIHPAVLKPRCAK
jgi:membrane-bound ClpP family serine protease